MVVQCGCSSVTSSILYGKSFASLQCLCETQIVQPSNQAWHDHNVYWSIFIFYICGISSLVVSWQWRVAWWEGEGVWHCDRYLWLKAGTLRLSGFICLVKCVSRLVFKLSCIKGTFLPSDTVHYFSCVAQWRVQAIDCLVRCKDVTELHPHAGEEQKLFDLPHSRLVHLSQLMNHLSFLAVIVSIDTTWHLTPTGLHNLVFLPGTHEPAHIQR